jgi:hypothetical protein
MKVMGLAQMSAKRGGDCGKNKDSSRKFRPMPSFKLF